MKYILSIALLLSVAKADPYYAKAEPLEEFTITSSVSGLITYVNRASEGSVLSAQLLQVDDALERKELAMVQKKIALLKQSLALKHQLEKNYKEIVKRKRENYENIKDLNTKSKVEKDRTFFDLMGSENQLIPLSEAIVN